MDYKIHQIASVMTGVEVAMLLPETNITQKSLIVGMSVIGTMLPDLDCPSSIPSKILFPLSWAVQLANSSFKLTSKMVSLVDKKAGKRLKSPLGHRGILHTFYFLAIFLLSGIFLTENVYASAALIGLGAGIGSHLLMDSINPMGIKPLSPLVKVNVRFMSLRQDINSHRFIALVVNTIVLVTIWIAVNYLGKGSLI